MRKQNFDFFVFKRSNSVYRIRGVCRLSTMVAMCFCFHSTSSVWGSYYDQFERVSFKKREVEIWKKWINKHSFLKTESIIRPDHREVNNRTHHQTNCKSDPSFWTWNWSNSYQRPNPSNPKSSDQFEIWFLTKPTNLLIVIKRDSLFQQ